MIAAQFDYVRAKTLDEALALLAQNEDAKILAGGHSLIPAMKLRLAQPPLLIDLGRIKDLSYIREEGGQIRLGAMTTHYEIESSDLLKRICPLLPECAGHIGALRQQRANLLQQVRRLDFVMRGHRAEANLAAFFANVRKVFDAAKVDEQRRLGQTQLHRRNQAVPAGENLCVFVLREQG